MLCVSQRIVKIPFCVRACRGHGIYFLLNKIDINPSHLSLTEVVADTDRETLFSGVTRKVDSTLEESTARNSGMRGDFTRRLAPETPYPFHAWKRTLGQNNRFLHTNVILIS